MLNRYRNFFDGKPREKFCRITLALKSGIWVRRRMREYDSEKFDETWMQTRSAQFREELPNHNVHIAVNLLRIRTRVWRNPNRPLVEQQMAVTSCKIFARPRRLHGASHNQSHEFAIPNALPSPRVFEGNCARANTGALIATKLGAYIKFLMEVFRSRFSPGFALSLSLSLASPCSRARRSHLGISLEIT